MLSELLSLNLFGFFLVFARIGMAVSLMPGIGAGYVPVRMRLGVALAISFVMAPALMPNLPLLPPSVAGIAVLLGGEIMIGAFVGTIARIMISALQTAGTVMAYSMSMANALIQDPIAEQQSSTVAGFLLTMGTVLIFVTDLHHLMIMAFADSYSLIVPGRPMPAGDISQVLARHVADSFALGIKLAAPFIIVALTYYIGLGFLGRLMPQLQVFFFGLPFQIGVQLWVLAITASAIMIVFLESFQSSYQGFVLP